MMIFLIILVVAILSVAMIHLFKRRRFEDQNNRYREYQGQTGKPVRTEKNRYARRKIKSPKKEVMPEVNPSLDENQEDDNVELTEDPDHVLGLKASTPKREGNESQAAVSTIAPPLVIMYLESDPKKPYTGYELLQAILSAGLRFGEHHIFHRHEDKVGGGRILFSLSSALKPGTFDLASMGSFTTPALTLFFKADQVDDPIGVYECLLDTINQLIDDLGGEVLDEQRDRLTAEKVHEQRALLQNYSRQKNITT